MSDTPVEKTQSDKSYREMIADLFLEDEGNGRGREIRWNIYLGLAIFLGLIVLIGLAFHPPSRWQSTASAFLLAGAAVAAGVLIGFLFGIPRARQQSSAPGDGQTPAEGFVVNTNLEQISDWLTKIIVGVGLIQLATFPGKLKALAGYFAAAINSPNVSSSLVLAILGYFAIFGFLLGYLWARIYLTGEFTRVERMTKDRPEYYEGLIHAYLYQPKPAGFQNAIKEGDKYIKRFGDNPRVWEYLACAYGQQYNFQLRDPDRDQSKLDQTKANALKAIKRAIQVDEGAREFLKRLWDPAVATPGEDDLRVFYPMPEFKKELDPETTD